MSGWMTIYKITWPNGKIYIGSDLTDTVCYFGSPDRATIEKDFPDRNSRRTIVIRKDILWESQFSAPSEVRRREAAFIREHESNDPAIGYNRWPRFKAAQPGECKPPCPTASD